MTGELWLETPCEHGRIGVHFDPDPERGGIRAKRCPGGSRRRVEVDYEAMGRKYVELGQALKSDGRFIYGGIDMRDLIDAALGGL